MNNILLKEINEAKKKLHLLTLNASANLYQAEQSLRTMLLNTPFSKEPIHFDYLRVSYQSTIQYIFGFKNPLDYDTLQACKHCTPTPEGMKFYYSEYGGKYDLILCSDTIPWEPEDYGVLLSLKKIQVHHSSSSYESLSCTI